MGHFNLPFQTSFYRGKVRDVYTISNSFVIMVASDRLSAFDVILPKSIPYKGQVLNELAAYMLERCSDIVPNWLLEVPAPHASAGYKCDPFKIEIVVRGNITGHAWRTYKEGKRELCGVPLPENMKEFDFFPEPIITPSTKTDFGHDVDISAEKLINQGLATKKEWDEMSRYSLSLFKRGNEIAKSRGLILADTKYEFGKRDGKIMLMDEVHTPDSSRYFYLKGFDEKQSNNEKQIQLSKEFVREWLIENNFMGKEGQSVPEMSNEFVNEISNKYIYLYELLTDKKFIKESISEEQLIKKLEHTATHFNSLLIK